MARVTGPDSAIMCNYENIHTRSYKQIWGLYTSIVPRGQRRPRNGKEQTGSGAGSKSGAGSENEGKDRG